MKKRITLAVMAAPVAFGAYVAFHPGVAFAESSMAKRLAPSAIRQAGSFTIDPMHTSVGFEVGHLGLSKVQGRFDKVSGKIQLDADITKSSVDVTMEADSVDTAVPPRDADLKSPNFFDATKFPELTFKSTSIKKRGSGYVADGDLTIKGVTKQVSIPFHKYGPIKDPWGNQRIGVVSDPITISRLDYGMSFDSALIEGKPMVGTDILVRLSAEATQDK